jgi:unsaturated rhamnogalacturonyl hydrolase
MRNRLEIVFVHWTGCLGAALLVCLFSPRIADAESAPWSERIANSLLQHTLNQPSSQASATWDRATGFQLEGLEAEWYNTARGDYYRRAKETVDAVLQAHSRPGIGNQPTDADGQLGRQVLLFYRVTLHDNYYHAAEQLRSQLTASCGIGVSEARPTQRDDQSSTHICTAEPFLSEFASFFGKPQDFAAITKDFLFWDGHAQAGVRGHSAKSAADEAASTDAELAAALVDSLGYYPLNESGRAQLVALLNRIASTAEKQLDSRGSSTMPRTGSSFSSCLYVYALLKGVRLGFLPARFTPLAEGAWKAIVKDCIHVNASGAISLSPGLKDNLAHEISQQAPPGSSLDADELRGTGALLLAATEVDLAPTATDARGQTVMVDSWYNSQQRKNAAGDMEYFHYKWSDFSDSGYSLLGHMFRSHGASLETLTSAPTRDKLSKTQFYIIVSPDIPIKNPNPNYMTEKDAAEIAAWVHDGGVLVLMENDPPNADITHLNLLADRFGIHFDDALRHHIIGEQVQDGRIPVAAGGPVFREAHTLYVKDTCAISISGAATALLRDRGDIVMASAKYGRGTVFAAVDPWVYNEYTDGRRNLQIYGQFDNFGGGKELVRWLLEQRPEMNSGTRKNVER